MNEKTPVEPKGMDPYKEFLEHTDSIVTQVDDSGIYIYVNPRFARLVGKEGSKLPGMSAFEDIFSEDREMTALWFNDCINGRIPNSTFENRIIRADGSVAHLLWTVNFHYTEDGKLDYVNSIAKEITQLKEHTQALQESQKMFSDLFNHMTDAFALHEIIIDESGTPCDYRFVEVNQEFLNRIHMERKQIIGKRAMEIFPQTEKAWIERFGKVAQSGKSLVFSQYSLELDRYYETRLYSPRKGLCAAIFADITQQKKSEEQEEQRRKMESIGRLAGGIAHDFNNSLSAILSAAELMQLNKDQDAPLSEQNDLLNMIIQSTERASQLTGKLLAFARKRKTTKTSFNLHSMLEDTQTMLARLISREIDIDLQLRADLDELWGDESNLYNSILNICINAAHAIDRRGSITLETENISLEEEQCLHSEFDVQPGPYIQLKISDTGRGIDPKHLNQIFEPFFSTKEQGQGTGLGLATAYGTVKEFQGSISVESTLGEGTSFTLCLPQDLNRS